MNCKSCNKDLTNVTPKTGISKKSGNPYKFFRCPDCEEANFVKVQDTKPTGNVNAVILKKIDKFLVLFERYVNSVAPGTEDPAEKEPADPADPPEDF